jgi:hypothetical protein
LGSRFATFKSVFHKVTVHDASDDGGQENAPFGDVGIVLDGLTIVPPGGDEKRQLWNCRIA